MRVLYLVVFILFAQNYFSQAQKPRIYKQLESGMELQELPKEFRKDKNIVLYAIEIDESNFIYADEFLRKDKEVVLAAVKKNGLLLEFADKSLQKDREVVLTAIKNYEYDNYRDFPLKYTDLALMDDKEIILESVKIN